MATETDKDMDMDMGTDMGKDMNMGMDMGRAMGMDRGMGMVRARASVTPSSQRGWSSNLGTHVHTNRTSPSSVEFVPGRV